ncbi:lactamase [bacterium (Candidatus Gribaldobacteria) CG23_combo_of_CG06-09_8_20_14_all_37_87_8]|uniref:Lactamase n=2 Tax=Candidatus Gribaldobacteria TaxID=2798536 RepID=A0A2G9ZEX3_9BACT|nr:MAG: hypothetical protein AUJ25_02235 [Parcubacteria group bacterium CG1_02_37_13]PIP31714.1 MAG: lactamase [bacterium (Candidatus Gribaldobacteria) CG23_combo_of_CG06-09_8_20_14_all_37_87_8]PIR90638.1 MAG: lactamase [bacterium (Candidatus Gribaldobacteria) CG10_big_fil_rev_8_21_14_0_10_37_21]
MEITFYGQSFFEVQAKNSENQTIGLVFDPFSVEIGLSLPKISSQIVLLSHDHPDHNNAKAILGDPFIIKNAGEYEVKGILIKGIPAFHDNSFGKERGSVIIFKIEVEGMKLCHLSDLGQAELTDEQVEEIGEVDVLFCPVGGVYTIDVKQASHIVSQIEPRLVIPMHYKLPKLNIELDELGKFLKQMGQEEPQKEKKFKVSPKTLPLEETNIIVLEVS